MPILPKVLIGPEHLYHAAGPHVDRLRAAGLDPVFADTKSLRKAAETIAAMRSVSAILAGGEYFTEEVINALPKLRVIARVGVGYDRVDVPAASRNGVVVGITPTANHEAVAEHAMAMILDLAKWITRQDALLRQGVWSDIPLSPLRGKTLGIVGLGRIGRSLAPRAAAFRMKLLACDKIPNLHFAADHGVELVSLETLLERSDFVSLHVPQAGDTRQLINADTIAQMKPGAFLINTSRGGLIDEEALAHALISGRLGGAALDVFAEEPPPQDHPFFQMENVIVTPHRAGGDTKSNVDMAVEAAEVIAELYKGKWPEGAIVNAELRERWKW